jgi:hypothetical protein
MKVYIGKYPSRWRSQIYYRYMNFKYGKFKWDDHANVFECFLEKCEDFLQDIYNKTINIFLDDVSRRVMVKIDQGDVWAMDNTISHIIVPMLKELNSSKVGSPFVDDEDVPEEIRSTSCPKVDQYDIDDNHHKRWEWVNNEMIWAFEQKIRDSWEEDYYEYRHSKPNKESTLFSENMGLKLVWEDKEGAKKHQERMSNGFRLFGKYFECLWS